MFVFAHLFPDISIKSIEQFGTNNTFSEDHVTSVKGLSPVEVAFAPAYSPLQPACRQLGQHPVGTVYCFFLVIWGKKFQDSVVAKGFCFLNLLKQGQLPENS